MSTPMPFPADPVLSGVVIAYQNAAFIADRVVPRLEPKLGKREFKWQRFSFGQMITIPDTRVGRKSKPNEVEFNGTDVQDAVEDFGLDDPIPNDDATNAPANYDPRTFAAQILINLVLLDREARVAAKVFNADTYGSGNKTTLSGSSQWSDPTSDPLAQIGDAADSMVMRPNKMLIGRQGWSKLRKNPYVLKAISSSGTDKGRATLQAAAELFEVDEIIVGDAWANAARLGQPVVTQRLWGKHALLFRQEAMANSVLASLPTFGWTAQYGERVSGSIPDPNIGLRGGVRVRSGESVKEVISAPDLGYFFQNIVS